MSRIHYLDRGLSFTPQILRRIAESIDPTLYDLRKDESRFSIREVLAHLLDWEPIWRGRVELAILSPGADIETWDEDAHAISGNYSTWIVDSTLEKFAVERQKTLDVYLALNETELAKTVVHPVLGELSIFQLAVFSIGHDVYHIEQISEYLDGRNLT